MYGAKYEVIAGIVIVIPLPKVTVILGSAAS